jgi:hypothetical protein
MALSRWRHTNGWHDDEHVQSSTNSKSTSRRKTRLLHSFHKHATLVDHSSLRLVSFRQHDNEHRPTTDTNRPTSNTDVKMADTVNHSSTCTNFTSSRHHKRTIPVESCNNSSIHSSNRIIVHCSTTNGLPQRKFHNERSITTVPRRHFFVTHWMSCHFN